MVISPYDTVGLSNMCGIGSKVCRYSYIVTLLPIKVVVCPFDVLFHARDIQKPQAVRKVLIYTRVLLKSKSSVLQVQTVYRQSEQDEYDQVHRVLSVIRMPDMIKYTEFQV